MNTPVFPAGPLKTNEKIEVTFQVLDQYENPYDPDEVMIDAEISCPDGSTIRVPCFYYESASYRTSEFELDGMEKTWMLRFICEQEGMHSLKLSLTDSTGEYESESYGFGATALGIPGIIRNDTSNHQYYRHSTGETFYPLGINIGWNSMTNYTTIINNFISYVFFD